MNKDFTEGCGYIQEHRLGREYLCIKKKESKCDISDNYYKFINNKWELSGNIFKK